MEVEKIFKKLFKSFMKQEDEYEFDDVDIVNGKLIFKSEKEQKKATLPKVEEIVNKWEENNQKGIEIEIGSNSQIIRQNSEETKLIVIENETENVIEAEKINEQILENSKRGRIRDIEGFYVSLGSRQENADLQR